MTNIQKYLAFLTAVEYKSFTKAAEILKYTQSGIIRIGVFTSVCSYWMPNIISIFQKDYPNIDYELLLGDYQEIENWIIEGRVDCGFLRLPTNCELETFSLEQDELVAVLPKNHPLADCSAFPMNALEKYPFLLLEKDDNTEIAEIFKKNNLTPNVRLTTWDDYAIMALVESGLGISILPRLILQRIPYQIIAKSLEEPAYREIGVAVREWKTSSLAVKRFMEYFKYR